MKLLPFMTIPIHASSIWKGILETAFQPQRQLGGPMDGFIRAIDNGKRVKLYFDI